MKNLLLTLLLLPALAAAKVPVEEDIVAKTSDPDSPFYYTSLMMRYNAGDETLTDEDYHYLYYGYAHQESYKPMEANPDLDKLLMLASGLDPDNPLAETLDAMLYVGEDALARDPFSPKILNLMAYAHGALGMAAMDHWTRSFMVYSRHGAMNLRCAAFTRLIFAPSRPA